ncbi:MAG TPA: hypothetical protein VIK25_00275 [Gemmatimonadaceae bacterium]
MRPLRFVLALALAVGSAPAVAQQPATQKLRVAVMDLSGSALKMQQATTGLGGGMPGVQTTTTVALPAPSSVRS